MTRFKLAKYCCGVVMAIAAFGFQCSSATNTFTLKRYSSIPPVARWTVFTSDGTVTILSPPKTDAPFKYHMSSATADSLEKLCSAYATFDTLYFSKTVIPNPSSIELEFQRNGEVKTIHINRSPELPPALLALLSYAGKIEEQGMERMPRR